jgi:hypothetical protein
LIRPDQIVAWRGNSDEAATEIISRVLARVPSRIEGYPVAPQA